MANKLTIWDWKDGNMNETTKSNLRRYLKGTSIVILDGS